MSLILLPLPFRPFISALNKDLQWEQDIKNKVHFHENHSCEVPDSICGPMRVLGWLVDKYLPTSIYIYSHRGENSLLQIYSSGWRRRLLWLNILSYEITSLQWGKTLAGRTGNELAKPFHSQTHTHTRGSFAPSNRCNFTQNFHCQFPIFLHLFGISALLPSHQHSILHWITAFIFYLSAKVNNQTRYL